MIYFVDTERAENGWIKIVVHRFDSSSGEHTIVYSNKGNVERSAYDLITAILNDKPKQVFFDKKAFGLVLYDCYIKELKITRNVKTEANGMMYYAP